jgi:hypothetical protein
MSTTVTYQEHHHDLRGRVWNVVDDDTDAVIGHIVNTRLGWRVRDAGHLVAFTDEPHDTPEQAAAAVEAARSTGAAHLTPDATGLSDFDRRILDAATQAMNRPDTFDPALLEELRWSTTRAWQHAWRCLALDAARAYAPLLASRAEQATAARIRKAERLARTPGYHSARTAAALAAHDARATA